MDDRNRQETLSEQTLSSTLLSKIQWVASIFPNWSAPLMQGIQTRRDERSRTP